ncbi:MAG: peptidylprolyl isomerase [Bacteroides sp.]|nr:peptidylprolyl isomerase [Bacteroides sp.]MCM1095428.1 hypothetical protein [Terasakiella sp.]
METIQPGKYVEIGYDLYQVRPDGTEDLVHQTDAEDPERLIIGMTPGLVEPLEKALIGLKKGDSFDVAATADEAFGQRSDEYVMELEKEIFNVDGKFDAEMVKVGEVLPMVTADGFQVQGRVMEVGKDTVKMDFNHPLAGSPVRFRGTVLLVRDATPEELKPACGCHGGDCGEGCSDGADSCGCHGGGCCH